MQLWDFVKDGELRNPTMLGPDGEECLIVVKNGTTTGITVGCATGIESFVRQYAGKDFTIHSTSMEIAVHSYSPKDEAFSVPRDSGSVVADVNGRIVGLLTGGSGITGSTDITYVSPYYFLNERVKRAFPNSHLFPIANA